MRKKKHLGFLNLSFYIKRRMYLALLLSKKIRAKKEFLTFSHVLKRKHKLKRPEPDLTPLYEDVLFYRRELFSMIEALICSEAEKLRGEMVPRDEFLQEARLGTLAIVDSLKFPKVDLIIRTLRKRLSKKRKLSEKKMEGYISIYGENGRNHDDEDPSIQDEKISAMLYRNGMLPEDGNGEPDLLEIVREAGLHEAESVIRNRKRIAPFIIGGLKFLARFHGLEPSYGYGKN